jgi:hypothetical protein
MELTIYSGYSFSEDTLQATFPCANISGPNCLPAIREIKHTIDNSLLFGLVLGYYVTPDLQIEGNFSIAPLHNFTARSNFPLFFDEQNVITYNYDLNMVYNFDSKGIKPYVTAGIGGITRDNIGVTTDFTYNFGVGSKFYYKDIGIRLELNDHITPDYFQLHTRKHVLQLQTGILLRLW